MKVRSADTEPSPALAARVAAPAVPAPPAVPAAPGPGAQPEADDASGPTVPLLLVAAGGVVAIWLILEGLIWSRRRSRRRSLR
jgi:hypothetical protein